MKYPKQHDGMSDDEIIAYMQKHEAEMKALFIKEGWDWPGDGCTAGLCVTLKNCTRAKHIAKRFIHSAKNKVTEPNQVDAKPLGRILYACLKSQINSLKITLNQQNRFEKKYEV